MPTTYSGKVKTVTIIDDKVVQIYFTDRITAGNNVKSAMIEGKGAINLSTSLLLFHYLEQCNVPTHMINEMDKETLLAEKLQMIPLEVVVRNIAYGSFTKRYQVPPKTPLSKPILEFFVKDDALGDPLIDSFAAVQMNYATSLQMKLMTYYALKINDILLHYFDKNALTLVDMKLEFGLNSQGNLVLGDELSMDSMRVWDKFSGVPYDKDRFRKSELELDVMEGYRLVYDRLSHHPPILDKFQNGSFVVLLSGSASDQSIVDKAINILHASSIPYQHKVLSAHRDPEDLDVYLKQCESHEYRPKIYICFAGLSAALPGVVAARVQAPVIGVPVSSKINLDSILSIVQMPPGVPVACVGLDNGTNAALLALRMIQ